VRATLHFTSRLNKQSRGILHRFPLVTSLSEQAFEVPRFARSHSGAATRNSSGAMTSARATTILMVSSFGLSGQLGTRDWFFTIYFYSAVKLEVYNTSIRMRRQSSSITNFINAQDFIRMHYVLSSQGCIMFLAVKVIFVLCMLPS
jgi:hypothetical protein